MKKAHRLIVQDISSIRSAFKKLVQEAQEANSLCKTTADEVTSICSSEYSTESEGRGTDFSDDEVYCALQPRPHGFRPSVSGKNTKRTRQRTTLPNSSELGHLARRQSYHPLPQHHHRPQTRDHRSNSVAVEYSDQSSHLHGIGHFKSVANGRGLSSRRHSTLPRHFVATDRKNAERIPKEESQTDFRQSNVAPVHPRSVQRRNSEIPKSVQQARAGSGIAAVHLDHLRRGSLRVDFNNLPALHEHMQSPRTMSISQHLPLSTNHEHHE